MYVGRRIGRAASIVSTHPRVFDAASRQCSIFFSSATKHGEGSRSIQNYHASSQRSQEAVPLRKHLKDEAKRKKSEKRKGSIGSDHSVYPSLEAWALTVGIEVHAELNTSQKLFSHASASSSNGDGSANSRVSFFDAALPGTQPRFQAETLLPAIRAAIALDCQIQPKSSWDRKHYFHWDQPNGYQITQHYEPFAKNGRLILTADDDLPSSDLDGASMIEIGIKQIQMEQDTAKTTHHPPSQYHVDLNRAGYPLIEIITLPQIHSPEAAAAVVRKIQSILKSVNACVTGMELGGLRADVNVSVRPRTHAPSGSDANLSTRAIPDAQSNHSYAGVTGLGQRTEIKNLSSLKAVEDAVRAEMIRQVAVLEAGGKVIGETRRWTLGATSTERLRAKEGEVDYRYLPDPDLAPLRIGQDLVDTLRADLPELPDDTIDRITQTYGLTRKDAKTLLEADDGERLDFMEESVARLKDKLANNGKSQADDKVLGRLAGNWVLHELGGLLSTSEKNLTEASLTAEELADILSCLIRKEITARTAKRLLEMLCEVDEEAVTRPLVDEIIEAQNWRLRPLSDEGYLQLAHAITEENPQMVVAVKQKGQVGKVMWFVGQMMRRGEEGTIEPEKAKKVIEQVLGL